MRCRHPNREAAMGRTRDMLRSGAWLTRERTRLAAAALLVASVAGLLYLAVTAHGLIDLQGRPLGTDFSNVYAAGTYVLDGDPEAPFDPVGSTRASKQSSARRRRSTAGIIRHFFCSLLQRWHCCPMAWRSRSGRRSRLCLYLLMIRAIVPLRAARSRDVPGLRSRQQPPHPRSLRRSTSPRARER